MLVLAGFLQSHFFCINKSCNHKAFIIRKEDKNGGLNLLPHKSDYKEWYIDLIYFCTVLN